MSLIKRVVFFVAAVAVAGCIMHVEHGESNWTSGNDNDLKVRRAIDATADQAIATLDFHVPYSSVTVTSNLSITRMRITGHVKELTENESSIEWTPSGPKLVTHSTPPARFDGVQIEVPAGTNLAVFSSSGSVAASNLAATQHVELNSAYGSIALRDCGAIPNIHLETSSGSVTVEKIESFHNLHVHSSYGSLEIAQVTGDADANLVANTSSGSIRMSGVRNARIDAQSSYGSVALDESSNITAKLASSSGSIKAESLEHAGDLSLVSSYGSAELSGIGQAGDSGALRFGVGERARCVESICGFQHILWKYHAP